ncbi:hypothetical protein E2C01_030215 [Portunus trituberculatus]|uniref:Uncharacterized protein n=1 Tax=Portunus trituberculatus TaxID=210409 RepID=A0A5B7EU54_PORTR|nr:hypothetical protein [Portunus trituberculatus]
MSVVWCDGLSGTAGLVALRGKVEYDCKSGRLMYRWGEGVLGASLLCVGRLVEVVDGGLVVGGRVGGSDGGWWKREIIPSSAATG